jgi:nitrous oxide reductase accessory protein NosL
MKQVLIAAALAMVVLTGCNREEEATVVPPQSSMPDSGTVGSTPSSDPSAMPADPAASTTTQDQLNPSATSPTPGTGVTSP